MVSLGGRTLRSPSPLVAHRSAVQAGVDAGRNERPHDLDPLLHAERVRTGMVGSRSRMAPRVLRVVVTVRAAAIPRRGRPPLATLPAAGGHRSAHRRMAGAARDG